MIKNSSDGDQQGVQAGSLLSPPGGASELLLFVDLDGTLVKTDVLFEAIVALIKQNIFYAFCLPLWLYKGRAYMKFRVAQMVPAQAENLPYHMQFLTYLRHEATQGRRLVLLTGSPQPYAQAIADHLGIFAAAHGSSLKVNLIGKAKLQCISEQYGDACKFSYAGNEMVDLPIWHAAHEGIGVNPQHQLVEKALLKAHPEAKIFREGKAPIIAFILGIRPYQWVKNLLLFVPLVAAHEFYDLAAWGRLFVAFVAFSLSASSAYLLNDLMDVGHDRQHPKKRWRPFASGDLSPRVGVVAAPIFLLAGMSLALWLSPAFFMMMGLYYGITCLYSFKLKGVLLIDGLTLAILYLWRILSGAVVVGISTSPWLLGFACFLFFSLALAKRCSELTLLKEQEQSAATGRSYCVADLPQVFILGTSSGLIAVLVLALYLNSEAVRLLYPRPDFLWPVCLTLLYWISRLWMLTSRGKMHHDPIVFAFKDGVSYVTALLIAVLVYCASYSA